MLCVWVSPFRRLVLISVLVVGVAGGGLKRPGDEALGVEGEGGSMFKMPRLDEVSV